MIKSISCINLYLGVYAGLTYVYSHNDSIYMRNAHFVPYG